VNTGLPGSDNVVYALAASGSHLFAGVNGIGVYRSTNNGTSWDSLNTGLTNKYIQCLAVSDTNVFAGTFSGGVFRTTLNGTSWTKVSVGLPDWAFVNAIVVSGTNLFAGCSYDGVFLSTDNGANWSAVNNDLTNTDVNALAVLGSNLFAGTSYGGVFLSTDNGINWAAVNTGMTGMNMVVLSLKVSGTNLFAGTEDGVLITTNNGTNWTNISSGLTNTRIVALAVTDTNLIAGTWGSGAWKRPLSELVTSISSNELPGGLFLLQNYPNPFKSQTTIQFNLTTSSFVKLSVFDLHGSEVTTLLNEQLKSGIHEVKWDATAYSSGVYYYKLFAGDKVETKKMILIK
jgi:ligand-binding sensor domain-containing protein